jgi:hypothetical protein
MDEEDSENEMGKVFDDVWANKEFIAETLFDAAQNAGNVHVYDKESGDYEMIPDYRARIQAVREIGKMRWLYSEKKLERKKRRSWRIFVVMQDA